MKYPDRLQLQTIWRYLMFMLLANLAWEFAHLPLYSIWSSTSPSALAFAVAHCTLGDELIAVMSLCFSVIVVGNRKWPSERFVRVAVITTILGIAYTIFSEWLNVSVRASWEYSRLMPVLPVLGTGLSPLLQWLVLPPLGLAVAARKAPPPDAISR